MKVLDWRLLLSEVISSRWEERKLDNKVHKWVRKLFQVQKPKI